MPNEPLFRFFEPHDEYFVIERPELPHWAQDGTMCFITWRTYDSMPRDVMDSWLANRNEWLRGHDINPRSEHWRQRLAKMPMATLREFHDTFSARFEALLDDCHGECVLRRPELAKIVGDSLRHFDGE